jgi:hypothetical protein
MLELPKLVIQTSLAVWIRCPWRTEETYAVGCSGGAAGGEMCTVPFLVLATQEVPLRSTAMAVGALMALAKVMSSSQQSPVNYREDWNFLSE